MSTQAVSVGQQRRLALRLAASWHSLALTGVLGLAALLNLVRLSQNGYANTYYSAAVRSMTRSWHNFFFASFDPGGLVSVDKPPLALWLEAASAKLLGYSGFTILLPEALAGVAAVFVLYLLVARYFGRIAGLIAAIALAVSPVSVAVNRDNNPDALFTLLLVAAAYVGARAVESGRLRTLVGAAVLVGLAFNTKMLAAALVVPGIALAYVLFARASWPRRIAHASVALVVLVAVSGAWIAAVDLTPAANRPYVGSTSDNSALSLVLDYNGLGRVTGQTGGTSFGVGLGGAFSGTPGWLRLINQALGDQGGWLLPLAIVGGVSLFAAAILRRRRDELTALTVVGGWFVAAAAIFSFSSGIIHTYYLSSLAPATSALVGAGVVALTRDARRGRAWVALPLVAIASSVWLEVELLQRSDYLSWLQAVVLVGGVAAVTAVAALLPREAWAPRWRRQLAGGALAVATACLLAAPAAWSTTVWKAAVDGVFPGAGPTFVSGLRGGARGDLAAPPGGILVGGGFGPPPGGVHSGGGFGGPRGLAGTEDIGAALRYVEQHGATTRFALIVQSEQEAAQAVIAGKPVAAMGGFTGRETVLTNDYLASLIRSHAARYFLLGSGDLDRPGRAANPAVDTITRLCKRVPSKAWSAGKSSSSTLYDCAGKADEIARP